MKDIDWIRQSNLIEGIDSLEEDQISLGAWEGFRSAPLSLESILVLHSSITQRQLPEEQRGQWRKCNVMVGGRLCPDWRQVPGLIENWFVTFGHALTSDTIKKAHVAFERIHPFVDGNGRTGRMIMNLQRWRNGFKPLNIKVAKRQDYYEWFKDKKDPPVVEPLNYYQIVSYLCTCSDQTTKHHTFGCVGYGSRRIVASKKK